MHVSYKYVDVKTDENGLHYVEGQAHDTTIYQLHPKEDNQFKFVVIDSQGIHEWNGCPSKYSLYYIRLRDEWLDFVEKPKRLEYALNVAGGIKNDDLTFGTNERGNETVSYFDEKTKSRFEIVKRKNPDAYTFKAALPGRLWSGRKVYEHYKPIFDKLMAFDASKRK